MKNFTKVDSMAIVLFRPQLLSKKFFSFESKERCCKFHEYLNRLISLSNVDDDLSIINQKYILTALKVNQIDRKIIISDVKIHPVKITLLDVIKKYNQQQKKSIETIKAPIAISYRGINFSCKDGEGMLFDHVRIQELTSFKTCTITPQDEKFKIEAKNLFLGALRQKTFKLPVGHPDFIDNIKNTGLLFIPGRTKKQENESIRLAHEYKILREAFNRGQPIIGICAGAWRVYEQFYIWTKYPDKLNKSSEKLLVEHNKYTTLLNVNDHVYSRMISLATNSAKANYNVNIHDIEIDINSILFKVMRYRSTNPNVTKISVNSVHSKAVNPKIIPLNIKISSKAKQTPGLERKNRKQNIMKPTENCVESFETEFGSPILGFQWHIEGYCCSDEQTKILKFMAKAGDAYAKKRKMLEELHYYIKLK